MANTTHWDLLKSVLDKIPWKRAQQPTPVFLPGESHGQKSAMVHWVIKNLALLKQLNMHSTHSILIIISLSFSTPFCVLGVFVVI